jgi:hypothetical protein
LSAATLTSLDSAPFEDVARALLLSAVLPQIPKLLTLQDRNPHSPTYGCFDRNYWHYRIIDFPSGMSQEFVWPLALLWSLRVLNNRYFEDPELKRSVTAGLFYAARSGHGDGSCDDYYLYERASGAGVFSLLACLESYVLLGMEEPELLAFFSRRAGWLSRHHESGRLSNHEALIALALRWAAQLTDSSALADAAQRRLERLLGWQSPEGWFPEYEGLDPGYHTLTISALARLHARWPDDRVEAALRRAADLALELVHPDGSYGGEYGSRNTFSFFPHGFELVGRFHPRALSVNDLVLPSLAQHQAAGFADDHIIGHHLWNYLLTCRDIVVPRPRTQDRRSGRNWMPHARLLIDRRAGHELYLSFAKGGCFKLFRTRELLASDTQASAMIKTAWNYRNAVGHIGGDYEYRLDRDELTVNGSLAYAKQGLMTPLRMVVLRVLMLACGRLFPNLIRRILQRLLITGQRKAPISFQRRICWRDGSWEIHDCFVSRHWKSVQVFGIGGDQTSIYVAMSRTCQPMRSHAWIDLTDRIPVSPADTLVFSRKFS